MSTAFSQDVQAELEKFVAQQVKQIPELSEDATDVAEYLVLLVNNGRTPEQAHTELSSIFTSDALVGVVQSAYNALADYQNRQATAVAVTTAVATATANAPQQQDQQQQTLQNATSIVSENGEKMEEDKDSKPNDTTPLSSIPTKPAAYNKFSNGVSKNGRTNGNGRSNVARSYALRNENALQSALNLSSAAGSDTFVNARGQIKKKGRCQAFPHCPNRDCIYAHPTKPCYSFLNGHCPNQPGTCNFLHPGEDDALIAELESTRKTYMDKKAHQQVQFAQAATGITLCKFGTLCTNQQCPFGHPTPANEDAKVTTFEWCSTNLTCQDASCSKAHSSLSKIKEVKPLSQGKSTNVEKSLEPCKFGANCTNRYCKFRHATSKTMCRDGENCTRIDCFFSHPIKEECRFGDGCKNPGCLFQHPNGKPPAAGAIQPKSLSWTKTNERQFAVPEDQILEQAPPQEG